MSRYAAETDVPADRSRAEIEKVLERYGAGQFVYGWDQETTLVGFSAENRQVRFSVPMPQRKDHALTETGKERTEVQLDSAMAQAKRQRWRALALVIKAKLEAVESGITSFDEEFLAHLVLPGGATVAQDVIPKVVQAYATGHLPKLLPGPKAKK